MLLEKSRNHEKLPLFWDMDLFKRRVGEHGELKHLEFLRSQITHLCWEHNPQSKRTCYWPRHSEVHYEPLHVQGQMSRILWFIRSRCLWASTGSHWWAASIVSSVVRATPFWGFKTQTHWHVLQPPSTICQVRHTKQNASPAPVARNAKDQRSMLVFSTVLIYLNLSKGERKLHRT